MQQNLQPITKNLIIINVLFFVATLIFQTKGIDLSVYFGAFYPESPNFKSWQLITHMFMHGGFMHILFNMYTLYMFGNIVEQTIGAKKYLILYFVAGLGSFILFNFANYFEMQNLKNEIIHLGSNPDAYLKYAKLNFQGQYLNPLRIPNNALGEAIESYVSQNAVPMVGASGAISGVLMAFAVLYPDMKLMLLFPPIPMKAKYLVPGFVLLEVYLGFANNQGDNVAHFAHVGGAIIGYFMVKYWKKNNYRIN